jgi:hypothetical protein
MLAPGVARAIWFIHDYDRGGAVAYLAAYDVQGGTVLGRCEERTGIEPFSRLVNQVMEQEPYTSADRFSGSWITGPPNAVMVHTRCTRRGSSRSRSTFPSSNEK